jgi:hypothetical protein
MVPQLSAASLVAVSVLSTATPLQIWPSVWQVCRKEVISGDILTFARRLEQRAGTVDDECLDTDVSLHRASRPVSRKWS